MSMHLSRKHALSRKRTDHTITTASVCNDASTVPVAYGFRYAHVRCLGIPHVRRRKEEYKKRTSLLKKSPMDEHT